VARNVVMTRVGEFVGASGSSDRRADDLFHVCLSKFEKF